MTDTLAGLKHKSTRQALIAAYEAYERREPGSMDRLLQLVRKFAFLKVSHLEYEPDFKQMGSAETADDWAQEVTIKVWQELVKKDKKRTGEEFYSWVHKIAFNRATDAFNDLLKQKKTKIPMFVSNEEEVDQKGRTETFTEENPLIHAGADGYGSNTLIPAHVEGLDLTICKLMLTEVQDQNKNGDYFTRGRRYDEVAFVLGMTAEAVQMRMMRLRKRNLEGSKNADELKEKKAAKRKQQQLEAELEAKNSVSNGLAKIRGSKP
jgi:hypothetical protein